MEKQNEFTNPIEFQQTSKESKTNKILVLYNDDINTFDFVINCLIDICNHDYVQAEQCALITHYKGKCDIKRGEIKPLKKMEKNLNEKGLIVAIE